MTYVARSFARFAVALGAALVLMLAWGGPAATHTELRASTPAEGSTVDSLSEVRLEFTSALLDIGSELTLVDAAGVEHELATQFPSENVVTGAVEDSLPGGATELQWRVVAEDGHPIEGVVSFTFAGGDAAAAPDSNPTATPESEPAANDVGTPETAATPEPTASAEPEQADEDEVPGWIWAVLAIVAIGGAAAAILARRTWRP